MNSWFRKRVIGRDEYNPFSKTHDSYSEGEFSVLLIQTSNADNF